MVPKAKQDLRSDQAVNRPHAQTFNNEVENPVNGTGGVPPFSTGRATVALN
jgi:hypothetical protein